MKKIIKLISIILSSLIVLSCISVSFVSAVGEVYSYSTSGEYATITRCNTLARGVVEIPSTYTKTVNGEETDFVVNKIGNGAFADCTGITEVVIPSSITKVGDRAFENCSSLEKAVFEGSTCEIGKSAFAYCSALKSITLPSSLKTISEETFNDCTSLSSVTIPSTVNLIGAEAFKMCTDLTNINIPASVTTIRKNAFIGCNAVKAFEVESGNPVYSDANGILYGPFESSYDPKVTSAVSDKTLIQYPGGASATSFSVPSDVKIIADYAFGENTKLIKVTLPEGLKSIEPYGFYMCKNLSEINIPSTVATIGSMAFAKCDSLKFISIPASVTQFESAFYDSGLEEVVFENGVKAISVKAFENCSDLKKVTIPDSVEAIYTGAFYNCSSLGETEIPSSVKTIGTKAFEGCTSLSIIAEEGSAAYEYAETNGIEISNGEELSIFQKIINAILGFFEMIVELFASLF